MVMSEMTMIPAGTFKAQCLALMDEVHDAQMEFVITKRGVPVSRLVPMAPAKGHSLFGRLRGGAEIHGDIVSGIDEAWDAEEG